MAGEIVRESGLTAAWVKSARPKDKPYKLSDRDGLYARGQYWDEHVRMMQHWSDYLDQLRNGATILRPQFGVADHDFPCRAVSINPWRLAEGISVHRPIPTVSMSPDAISS